MSEPETAAPNTKKSRPAGDPSPLLADAANALDAALADLDRTVAEEVAALRGVVGEHADGSAKHGNPDAAHVALLRKARFELSEAQRGANHAAGALDRFKALIPRAAEAHAAAKKERAS